MIPSRTLEDLMILADDIAAGKVFARWQLEDELQSFSASFAIFAYMDRRHVAEVRRDAGLVYEYLTHAARLAVHNQPIFFSAQLLNKTDAQKLRELVYAHA